MNFDEDTCSKNMKSLMLKGYKVIERLTDTGNPAFSENDIFVVNETFSSNVKRVVLPTPIIEEAYKKEII